MRGSLGTRLVRLVGLATAALVAVGVVESAWAAGGAVGGDPLVRAAQLRASDAPLPLFGVAVSGHTVFGIGYADVSGHQQRVVFVFSEPAGGWSGAVKQTAMLVASDGTDVAQVAASGPAVVANGGGAAYVFSEPPGGWSGTVHEVAKLTASEASGSGFSGFRSIAIEGQTIVAGSPGSGLQSPGFPESSGATYVFTEPVGGWSGTLHESAKLTASDSAPGNGLGSSVAISGQTIAASAPYVSNGPDRSGAVYVFTEPAGGWSTETEAAKLTSSGTGVAGGSSIAVSAQSVFASAPSGGACVFTEPAGGWSGTVHETATLTGSDNAAFFSLAASGQTVVAAGTRGTSVFNEPAGGWASETEAARLPASGQVALSGQTVVTGGGGGPAYVFVEQPGGWMTEAAAVLTVVGEGAEFDFASAAISGGVLVAGEPFAGPNQNQPAVYLFTRPAGGWADATESAKLLAPDGESDPQFGSSVAMSGDTVVVGYPVGWKTLCVFTKPQRGWSGALRPQAELTVGDRPLGAFAISGETIVVGVPQENSTERGAVYVFTKPAHGWTGTVHPSASLSAPRGVDDLGGSLAITGRDIFASGTNRLRHSAIYVFSRPKRGWSGTVGQRAALTSLSTGGFPLAVTSSYVVTGAASRGAFASALIFTKPKRGWSGSIRPATTLRVPLPQGSGQPNGGLAALAASASTIAAIVSGPFSSSCASTRNVCGNTLYTFGRPNRGWKGTIAADSRTVLGVSSVGLPLTIQGQTIATGGQGAIDIFTHAASINTLLADVLTPSGKAAKIAALLKNGGYTYSLRTLSGGRMTIAWYYLPNGANLNKPNRKPKPVLAATGNTRFTKAAVVRITIKLTKSGKRILKHARSLKLTAKGTYTPTGHPSVTATKKLTLKR